MKRFIFTFLSFYFFQNAASAQCPTAAFTNSGTVCAGQTVTLTNSSTNATSFNWDFCAGDFDHLSTTQRDPNAFDGPVGVTPIFDGTSWFVFLMNDLTTSITRLDYGNSLKNEPTVTNIGNPNGIMGGELRTNIVFKNEGGNWYGIVALKDRNKLVKLDFGTDLTNSTPATSVIINDPVLNGSFYQTLVEDNDSIFLFVGNFFSTSLVVASFGTSINNTPTLSTLPILGEVGPVEASFVKSCGTWYGFVISFDNNDLLRMNFGNSLSNIPTVASVVGQSIPDHPMSLKVANDGKSWSAFIELIGDGSTKKYDFGTSITSIPVESGLIAGSPSDTSFERNIAIVKDSSDFYLFRCSRKWGKLSKTIFSAPCSAPIPVDTSATSSQVTYSSGGTYYVELTATDANGNSSFHTDSIVVNSLPDVTFSVLQKCLGDVTLFTDSTSIYAPNIVTWHWDFGDTDTSDQQNDIHTYLLANSYNVSLTTTDDNGCSNTKIETIEITPLPIAAFSAPAGCSRTELQFTDLSTILSGTVSGWHWDFGSGDTSDIQSPLYSYPGWGTYPVTLDVTSDAGCMNSTTSQVIIDDRPYAGFDETNTCIGQSVQFLDQTSSQSTITSYHWDFGNNNDTSNVQSPLYAYPSVVSVYDVSLITYAANGCIDTVTQQIKINNVPTADFDFAPLNACEGNNVTFNDLSVVTGDTTTKWFWDFGDTFTDTVKNPVHQYATNGNYNVTLIAYSPSSCGNSVSHNVSVIESPTASFTNTDVCLGFATLFTDQSSAPTGSTIDHYLWDFGDTFTDTLQNPSHVFQTPGNHHVILQITSNFGCTDTFSLMVVVHHLPVASFTNSNPCTINAVHFNNTSTVDVSAFITNYQWNFGNPSTGIINNNSSLTNPNHLFDTTGSFVTTLITTTNFGCMDTAFSVLDVHQSSDASFQYLPTCFGDLVQFTHLTTTSVIDSAFVWTFGDNPFNFNQLENPVHYYAAPGTYNVTLTVYATMGCVTSVIKPVTVSPIPIAAFVHSPVCVGSTYQFLDSSYISSGTIVGWKWNFGGLDSSTVKNPSFTFPDTGNYTVKFTVTSGIGCSNTVTRVIHVNQLPVANFSFTPQYGNPPLLVSFQNLSGNLNQNTYSWNFGDNSTGSSLQSPQHLYTDTSLFPIQLIATSGFGCKDTIQKNIYVIKPVLDIAVTGTTSYILDNHLHIVATLANLGTRTINTFKMEAHIENGTPIQESYVQTLPNGFTGQLELAASMDLGSGQAKYYCVSATDPDNSIDNVPSNNELCRSLTKEFSVVNPYPNPFNDQLSIQLILPYKDLLTIDLFDISGKLTRLYEGIGQEGLNKYDTDLSDLSGGTYAVRCKFRETEIIKTIVKVELKK